jgi:hypothetical protein
LSLRHALHDYLAQLHGCAQAAWTRLNQVALETTASGHLFPSREVYTAALETARPLESPLDVARRLGIELTLVLLAYAEWVEVQAVGR